MFGNFQFLKCGVVNFGNNGLDICAVWCWRSWSTHACWYGLSPPCCIHLNSILDATTFSKRCWQLVAFQMLKERGRRSLSYRVQRWRLLAPWGEGQGRAELHLAADAFSPWRGRLIKISLYPIPLSFTIRLGGIVEFFKLIFYHVLHLSFYEFLGFWDLCGGS